MKKYLSKKYLALFQAVLIFVWLAEIIPLRPAMPPGSGQQKSP